MHLQNALVQPSMFHPINMINAGTVVLIAEIML